MPYNRIAAPSTDALNSPVTAEEIAQRDPKARKSGSGYKICCPAHNGEDPNCYIADGDDGLVAKCWSHGCSWAEVMQALGVPLHGNGRLHIASYQHRDGQDRHVYRRDDSDGNKSIWGKGTVPGTKILLWGDDDPATDTLVFVEGEKSAKALMDMRLANVTPVSWRDGAKSVKHADMSEAAERHCILWPDDDDQGREAMDAAADMLFAVGATSISIISTGGNTKEDAADHDAAQAKGIIATAEKWQPSHGGARPSAGRPPSSTPSPKTQQNQRSQRRTALKNWSFENTLPRWAWLDDLVDADTERLITFLGYRLATDGNSTYLATGSTWEEVVGHRPPVAKIMAAISDARTAAVWKLGKEYCDLDGCAEYAAELRAHKLTGRHVREVADTLAAAIPSTLGIRRVAYTEFDRRESRPMIPLNDGRAVDLSIYPPKILPAEKALSGLMRDHGWSIPAPDFSILKQTESRAHWAITQHYGATLFDRLSAHLLGIDKSIDSLVAGTDFGKSTLIELLSEAFPGAVQHENMTGAFGEQSRRFTPVVGLLAKALIVIVDEVGHDGSIPPAMINEFAQGEITQERKGKDRTKVKRIGSLLFVGFDFPPTTSTSQGFGTRFKWSVDMRESEPMSWAQSRELLHPDNVAFVRAWMMHRAADLYKTYGCSAAVKDAQCNAPDVKAAVKEFTVTRIDPWTAALREAFEPRSGGFVSSAEIAEVITKAAEEGDKPPKGKKVPGALRRAFHDASIKCGVHGVKRNRGYFGIQKREQT